MFPRWSPKCYISRSNGILLSFADVVAVKIIMYPSKVSYLLIMQIHHLIIINLININHQILLMFTAIHVIQLSAKQSGNLSLVLSFMSYDTCQLLAKTAMMHDFGVYVHNKLNYKPYIYTFPILLVFILFVMYFL